MNVNIKMPTITDLTSVKSDTTTNISNDSSKSEDKTQFKNLLNNIKKDKVENDKQNDDSTPVNLKNQVDTSNNKIEKTVDKEKVLTKEDTSKTETQSDKVKKLKDMLDKGEINLDQLVALLSSLLTSSTDKTEAVKSDASNGKSENDLITKITSNFKDNNNLQVFKVTDEKQDNLKPASNTNENTELADILKQMISETKAKNPELLDKIKGIVNSYESAKTLVQGNQLENLDNNRLTVDVTALKQVTQSNKSENSLKNDIANLLIELSNKADEAEKTVNASSHPKLDNLSKLITAFDKKSVKENNNDKFNITNSQVKGKLNIANNQVEGKLNIANNQVEAKLNIANSDFEINQDNLNSTKSNSSITIKTETEASSKTEDKLLKSIITGDDPNKTSKLNVFLVNLNNQRSEVAVTKTTDIPVVNKNSMVQDIVKSVNYMNSNNLKELTVKIAPRELGEIVIKLTLDSGNTRASISAHNKEAYDILSSSLNDIKSALGNNELKIQNVNINIYQDDTTFFRNSFAGNGQQGNEQQNQNQKTTTSTHEVTDEIDSVNLSDDNNLSAWV